MTGTSCVQVNPLNKSDLFFEEDDGNDGAVSQGGTTVNPLFLKARKVLNNRCLSCHTGSATNWTVSRDSSEQEWLTRTPEGLIVAGDPEASIIVQLMIYRENGTMPEGATKKTFQEKDFQAIVDWIASAKVYNSEEEAGLIDGEPVIANSEKISLSDRTMLSSVYQNIFGDNALPVLQEKVMANLIVFGGPCAVGQGWNSKYCTTYDHSFDFHSGESLSETKFLNKKHYVKVDQTAADATMEPESSPLREGYRTQSCEEIVFNSTFSSDYSHPIFHAITEVKKFEAQLNSQAAPSIDFDSYPSLGEKITQSELEASYKLFHNFRTPTSEELESLKMVTNKANELITEGSMQEVNGFPVRFETWRYLLYFLCLTPSGQIL